jgi:hypothetical protein
LRATEVRGRRGFRGSRAGLVQHALDLAELVGHDLKADVDLRAVL